MQTTLAKPATFTFNGLINFSNFFSFLTKVGQLVLKPQAVVSKANHTVLNHQFYRGGHDLSQPHHLLAPNPAKFLLSKRDPFYRGHYVNHAADTAHALPKAMPDMGVNNRYYRGYCPS